MEENAKHAAIVRTVIELARDLGIHTVAEGVESEAQLRLLTELGCRAGQGHLFAPALDEARLEKLFEQGELALAAGHGPEDEAPAAAGLLKRTRDFFRRV